MVKFVFNIFGALALQQYPKDIDVQITKRIALIEKLSSIKDLIKLQSLVNRICKAPFDPIESALMSSMVDLQMYMQSA